MVLSYCQLFKQGKFVTFPLESTHGRFTFERNLTSGAVLG
jgi:hypothetical protein